MDKYVNIYVRLQEYSVVYHSTLLQQCRAMRVNFLPHNTDIVCDTHILLYKKVHFFTIVKCVVRLFSDPLYFEITLGVGVVKHTCTHFFLNSRFRCLCGGVHTATKAAVDEI